jgi:hypothetical protein
MARAWLLVALLAGCESNEVIAVGAPGGAFQSGAGCVVANLAAGSVESCNLPAQFGFEHTGDDQAFAVETSNLSQRRVSCERSYCGTGSLRVTAQYRRRLGATEAEGDWLGRVSYTPPAPLDLYGKMLGFKLYIDGPATPVNAMLAVIDERGLWHKVHDYPVYGMKKWHERGAPLSPQNEQFQVPPTPSLIVKQIEISVYLATEVRTGDGEHWTGDVFIDEVGWR